MRRKFYLFPVGTNFWTQETSKALSFTLILLLSVLVMWYTVNTAQNVLHSFESSLIGHPELRPGFEEGLL